MSQRKTKMNDSQERGEDAAYYARIEGPVRGVTVEGQLRDMRARLIFLKKSLTQIEGQDLTDFGLTLKERHAMDLRCTRWQDLED